MKVTIFLMLLSTVSFAQIEKDQCFESYQGHKDNCLERSQEGKSDCRWFYCGEGGLDCQSAQVCLEEATNMQLGCYDRAQDKLNRCLDR